MSKKRDARQAAIVYVLRSREWTTAKSLADRFGVTVRTIYRDTEDLIAAGVPIEAITGPEGGYRLASDKPLPALTLEADDALKLHMISQLEHQASPPPPADTSSNKSITNTQLRNLIQRIYLDTADWYWKDEGSAHLPAVRHALLDQSAIQITTSHTTTIAKPYGLVWKAGEWHLVAEPIDGQPERYRLNQIDRVAATDLHFTYPDDFDLRTWWTDTMEDYGQGTIEVRLRVSPAARDELLRLALKKTSTVEHPPEGGLVITLHVDRWEWLVPLVTSYGRDVIVEQPQQLRQAVIAHLTNAVTAYQQPATTPTTGHTEAALCPTFTADDSRLRSTRGRTPPTTH
jgi:predicted DNA-binding transcriptional regulator YafY